MSSATIEVTPVLLSTINRNRENGTRERFPQREAHAKVLFAKATYIGALPQSACDAVVSGKEIKLLGAGISAVSGKHGPATCALCGGTHGKEGATAPITRADLMQKQSYFAKADGSVFGISDSCRVRYLDDKAKLLTNEGTYRTDFPKQPVK